MTATWHELNWQYLLAAIEQVRRAIEQGTGVGSRESGVGSREAEGRRQEAEGRGQSSIELKIQNISEGDASRTKFQTAPSPSPSTPPPLHPSTPPPLNNLCARFNLSPFERDVLLACAGIELHTHFKALVSQAQGDPQRDYPTLNLLLMTLPDAHWSAFTPNAPLRHWRLIEVEAGRTLTHSPLRIDERILHYLLGEPSFDDRLRGTIQPIAGEPDLVPSQQQIATQIANLWTVGDHQTVPLIQLYGSDAAGKRAIATTAATLMGRNLYRLSAQTLPTNSDDLTTLSLLWEREATLSDGVLLIDAATTTVDAAKESATAQLIEGIRSPVIVSSRDRDRALFAGVTVTQQRPLISLEAPLPTQSEQRQLWQTALGEAQTLNGHIEPLVAQFNLSAPIIYAVCAEALGKEVGGTGHAAGGATPETQRRREVEHSEPGASTQNSELKTQNLSTPHTPHPTPHTHLWDLCRIQSRPEMDDLAERIEAVASWDDLVLPEAQRQVLRSIASHIRQKTQVYEQWGFGTKGKRGLGISALFAGASGTGKTMAAEVLAQSLRLDLYRIDLSAVVSKYIGETEKNLRRIFDAAESGSVILLFDEADALFGKRSEVKDSHDRYANMEVSYLLQRMEAYQGLAILTTNMKEAIDTAFLRRIRFIIKFPFPDAPQREEIWRRVFPKNTPLAGIDVAKLARLNVAGGNIRNIALNAAFLAADAGDAVRMEHLRDAALSEYAKLERTLTEAETRGWGSEG